MEEDGIMVEDGTTEEDGTMEEDGVVQDGIQAQIVGEITGGAIMVGEIVDGEIMEGVMVDGGIMGGGVKIMEVIVGKEAMVETRVLTVIMAEIVEMVEITMAAAVMCSLGKELLAPFLVVAKSQDIFF